VCRCFLEQIPDNCNVAYIFNPKLTVTELLQSVCDEFHLTLPEQAGASVKTYVDVLNAFLLREHAQGRNNVLIIDEAQNLSADVLEQLRLLTNLETHERKLLQIILIGQPELRDLLAAPHMEQLAQRVIARFHLQALSEKETAQYIAHRLQVAGLTGPIPFERAALGRIHQIARGVPRRINLLCNRALLGAYAWSTAKVDRRIVDLAAKEVFDAHQPRPRWVARLATPAGRAALALAVLLLAGMAWLSVDLWRMKNADSAALNKAPPSASGASIGKASGTSGLAVPGQNAAPVTAAPPSPTAAAANAAPDLVAASSSAAAPVVAPVVPAVAAVKTVSAAELQSVLGPLLRDENEAWRSLAKVWQIDTAGADPCTLLLRQHNVHCFKKVGTLALLRQLDRPGLLTLYTARNTPVLALLTGLSAEHATLDVGSSRVRISLETLAQVWRGEFATLWRAPTGYRLRLAEGESSPVVEQLSQQLARYSGTPAAPGTPVFNNALRIRLQAFQLQQELLPDGQAGPMTFMRLNRATGMDEPRLLTLP
ncbi:MAG: AAA family ATPase, partial [Burkholderiaceae bacterium]